MKLGAFFMPVHPPEKDKTESFDEDVQFVVDVEKLDFTEIWCGHHVTVEWEPVPANDIFLANLIARTKKIKLGVGVSILPQHHPVNVAARVALLDHLAHGRIYWGFGQGGVPTDWELFGLPEAAVQGRMTGEALKIILMLWTQDPPYDFKGEFWQVKLNPDPELRMGYPLKPYQKPHPPIGMTMMAAKGKGAFISGELGYMPMSINLVHQHTVAQHWKSHCEGAASAGREPDRGLWRVARSIYIGESNDEAWDFCVNSTFGRSFEYMLTIIRNAGQLGLFKTDESMPDEEITLEYVLKNICIIGDKKSVKEQLESLWDLTGGFGTLLYIKHDFDDKERWQRCTRVLAEEVVPTLPTVAVTGRA